MELSGTLGTETATVRDVRLPELDQGGDPDEDRTERLGGASDLAEPGLPPLGRVGDVAREESDLELAFLSDDASTRLAGAGVPWAHPEHAVGVGAIRGRHGGNRRGDAADPRALRAVANGNCPDVTARVTPGEIPCIFTSAESAGYGGLRYH